MEETDSSEASPTNWSCYANISVFIDRIRNQLNQFLKKMNNDNDLNLHSMTKLSGWLRHCERVVKFVIYDHALRQLEINRQLK